MRYKTDVKTENELSVLGFGCMRLPGSLGRIDIAKAAKLITAAVENGVNYFDTAYIYPGSEAALGQILEQNGLREKVYIATKLPIVFCRAYSDFDKYLERQLERLKTDYIDYYLMHMLTGMEQWEALTALGIERWIAEKRAQGKIRQAGFSFHGKREEFMRLVDAYDWDFCQIQYNYVDINNQAGKEGLLYAAAKGLPVFIMEPLLGGRLASWLPDRAAELFKEADPQKSPAAWALRWVWSHPGVTLLLSGMSDEEQLFENIATACGTDMMTEKELGTVDEARQIFKESFKIPCTGCGYCMPCPKNINIPGCFAAYNASYYIGEITGLQQYMSNTGAMLSGEGSAGACVKCGKCEKKCPQGIAIRSSLEDVRKRMEPIWYRAVIPVVRWFMKRKK